MDLLEGAAMPGRVAGKGIVITGAGSGMGRAFALGLAREGASIGVLDVDRRPPAWWPTRSTRAGPRRLSPCPRT